MLRHWFALASVCLAVTTLNFGCGDEGPIEELEQISDCAQICERFADCRDANVDLTACTDRCEDASELEPAIRNAADVCEDCLDDRSCQEAEAANCWDGCPVFPLED